MFDQQIRGVIVGKSSDKHPEIRDRQRALCKYVQQAGILHEIIRLFLVSIDYVKQRNPPRLTLAHRLAEQKQLADARRFKTVVRIQRQQRHGGFARIADVADFNRPMDSGIQFSCKTHGTSHLRFYDLRFL